MTGDASAPVHTLFIGGRWHAAADGRVFVSFDPASGEAVGHASDASDADTLNAIDAADEAFKGWSRTTAARRAALLHAAADRTAARTEELAALITAEQGKTLREARNEVAQAVNFYRWFAEEGRRAYGQVIPDPQSDRRLFTRREPVGVVAAITPWNIPAAAFARKVAPALAAGCTVVFKPAEQTPLIAVAMAKILEDAGLPEGVMNLVTTADAPAFGQAIARDARVRKIAFTGSTEVGRILLRLAADTVKRTSMELGGNAPVIVMADADLDRALRHVMQLKFRNAGQACISANRIYVQRPLLSEFSRRLAAQAAALRMGAGEAAASEMGPLVDRGAQAKVARLVDEARTRGAQVLAGGAAPAESALAQGSFYAPTVIVDAPSEAALHHEEIFGPVAPLYAFDTEEEALTAANGTPWGLGAYLFTENLGRAWRMAEALQAGMVGVNDQRISTVEAPFGGIKESGMGREGGSAGLDDYLQTKLIALGL